MEYYKKIIGSHCYLSPVSENDSKNWAAWLDVDEKDAKSHITRIRETMEKVFSVVDRKTEKAVGRGALTNINPLYQNCSMEVLFPDAKSLQNGFAVEGIKLLLDYAFNCINMHSVSLIIPENEDALITCFREAGFTITARRRESLLINDKRVDEVYLDIVAGEYTSVYINSILEELEGYSV